MQPNKKGRSIESAQPASTSVEQRVADFEKRMNYKAKPLSEAAQEKLEAKFRSASRMKRWQD
jgi:hypothetical protein